VGFTVQFGIVFVCACIYLCVCVFCMCVGLCVGLYVLREDERERGVFWLM